MKGLLIKDFYINFLNKRAAILYIFLSFFMAFSIDGAYIVAYTTMLFGILAISTLSYDEHDNGFPFLMSLPIKRKTYIKEKYVYIFILMLVGSVFGLIVYYLVTLIKTQYFDFNEIVSSLFGSILVIGVMMSIMVPIQLKYGVEKSRAAMFIIYGMVFALALLTSRFEGMRILALRVVSLLGNSSEYLIALIVILICLSIILTSYVASVRIIENKEF